MRDPLLVRLISSLSGLLFLSISFVFLDVTILVLFERL
jgi:hypothetical protein